jgi:hypothetical protein
VKEKTKNSAFFHTLVVVGGTIASCGGQAQDAAEREKDEGDGDGASSGGTSTGGRTGGGGSLPSGGNTGIGDGDIIIIGSGGSLPEGGTHMGGAHGLGCPPEQWDCSDIPYDCSWQESELLGNCVCDPTKPRSQNDCPAGTAFTCMEGIERDANYVGTHLPFACDCLPQEVNCLDQCRPLVDYPSDCFEPTDDFVGYLCGCELPVLR